MSNIATYKGQANLLSNVEFVSTASTVVTLTYEQQDKWLFIGGDGWSSAARVRLPAPEAGIMYRIFFSGDAVSSATKITCSGAYDIYYAHVDRVETTGKAVSLGSTLEGGAYLQLLGMNAYRWAVVDAKGSTVNGVNLQTTST